jgi:hypothetical protein
MYKMMMMMIMEYQVLLVVKLMMMMKNSKIRIVIQTFLITYYVRRVVKILNQITVPCYPVHLHHQVQVKRQNLMYQIQIQKKVNQQHKIIQRTIKSHKKHQSDKILHKHFKHQIQSNHNHNQKHLNHLLNLPNSKHQ